MAIAWLLVTVILAGPTYKQLPQPLHQSEQAMVVVLDLSPSMLAEDNKPSRIVRARLKIQDLLTQRKDGLTALVVYAGEAHVVTPLTDDTKTIINLLSTLTPGLLPIPGSNVEMAMAVSKQLISDSGLSKASIVLVTDGIDPRAQSAIQNTLTPSLSLSIIGVGTEKGAPIPSTNSQQQADFLRDSNNQIVTVSRNEKTLKSVAQSVNGYYLPLQANDSDIAFILQQADSNNIREEQSRQLDRNMDQWDELGPILLLICLPLFALMFRRGWLIMAFIGLAPALMPEPAYALSWDDIWLNENQRAQKSFAQKNYEQAEEDFSHPQWQGSAAYKNKNYKAAVEAFSQGDSATDDYNKGNALSQLQQWDDAIAAYDSALSKDPSLDDAKKNKDIVKQLKAQEEKQQQDQKNNESQENDKQQDQDKENQDSSQQKGEEGKESQDSKDSQDSESSSEKNNQDEAQKQSQQQEQEKQSQEEKEAQQASEENKDKGEDEQEANAENLGDQSLAHLSEEEKQELEQWIRKIPDDPSGLLRRKFKYEFQKRRQLYQSGKWKLPDNNAHERY